MAISYHGFDLHGFTKSGNMKWFKGTLPNGEEAYISNVSGWGSQMPPEDGLRRLNMNELIEGDGQYFYDIPYRALVHKRLENVLAAGRNLSSDVPGQSGTRLIMCCMAMGEAAGNACALSLKEGVNVRDVNVADLQRILVGNKCNIGQGYRKIASLDEGVDYSEYAVEVLKRRNGKESDYIEMLNKK